MRKFFYYSILFLLLTLCDACGVKRYLPKGERLYNGPKLRSEKAEGVQQSTRSLHSSLKGISQPRRNKRLFGAPYKVWFWYVIGSSKKEKGLKHWLRNKIGEPPVLFSSVDTTVNAENMEAWLENEGYFHSRVSTDSSIKGYKASVVYKARIETPYILDTILWRLDSSQLSQEILALPSSHENKLKKGERYRVENIKAESERISQLLKERGYYYFRPDHILTYVDTNHNSHSASVYLSIDEEIPAYARIPYTIGKVVAVVPEKFTNTLSDSTLKTLGREDGILISDHYSQFKPVIFPKAIVFREGQLYSPVQQAKTLTRLNSYGVFKFIRTDFRRSADSNGKSVLNSYYYTSPYTKKSLQFEVGAFAKSNSYWGGEVSVSWKNRNIFRGAEMLSIKPIGSFELSYNDSLKNNNTWRVGIESELVFPKFLAPGFRRKSFAYIPKTKIVVSYNWLRRQELYTEYYAHFRYELNWSNKVSKEHTLIPVSFTHRTSGSFTEDFHVSRQLDSKVEYTVPSSLVPSSSYRYVFSNTQLRKRKVYYLQAGIETSGFIVGAIKGNSGPFTTKIGDAQLMQYLRGEFEVRYSSRLGGQLSWFNRSLIGLSLPYGNSVFLPFYKQFLIGGANSLRGFQPKQIGPGSAKANAQQLSAYPQIGGDYKLEMNSELRYSLSGKLSGGLFVDAGNIWMKDTLLYSTNGKLTKDFWKQIAIDAGFGFRFDISVLVIRLDLGIPFYKPWLPEGDRWTFNDFNFFSGDWRRENLVWNLAIGHAF